MTPDTNFDTWQVHDYKHTCQSIVLQKHDRKPKESVKKIGYNANGVTIASCDIKKAFLYTQYSSYQQANKPTYAQKLPTNDTYQTQIR